MLAVSSTITLTGILKPDGTLELEKPPELPPGPVRVTLQVISKEESRSERLPDLPILDVNIPAPFDLPRPGKPERVEPRQAKERLPEPFAGNFEDER